MVELQEQMFPVTVHSLDPQLVGLLRAQLMLNRSFAADFVLDSFWLPHDAMNQITRLTEGRAASPFVAAELALPYLDHYFPTSGPATPLPPFMTVSSAKTQIDGEPIPLPEAQLTEDQRNLMHMLQAQTPMIFLGSNPTQIWNPESNAENISPSDVPFALYLMFNLPLAYEAVKFPFVLRSLMSGNEGKVTFSRRDVLIMLSSMIVDGVFLAGAARMDVKEFKIAAAQSQQLGQDILDLVVEPENKPFNYKNAIGEATQNIMAVNLLKAMEICTNGLDESRDDPEFITFIHNSRAHILPLLELGKNGLEAKVNDMIQNVINFIDESLEQSFFAQVNLVEMNARLLNISRELCTLFQPALVTNRRDASYRPISSRDSYDLLQAALAKKIDDLQTVFFRTPVHEQQLHHYKILATDMEQDLIQAQVRQVERFVAFASREVIMDNPESIHEYVGISPLRSMQAIAKGEDYSPLVPEIVFTGKTNVRIPLHIIGRDSGGNGALIARLVSYHEEQGVVAAYDYLVSDSGRLSLIGTPALYTLAEDAEESNKEGIRFNLTKDQSISVQSTRLPIRSFGMQKRFVRKLGEPYSSSYRPGLD